QQSPRTQEVKTKLIFQRHGDHYILASAELPNTNYGRAFSTGKVEGQIAQAQPKIVEIAGK
ncbi:MAG TPA: hypothetical protein VMU45_12600, partial [Candidatus Eisenbacteria bacterium]|nr:hypothetical protein [Candidatus Eisenbacteria bacterium]